MTATPVRRTVVQLCQVGHRLGLIADSRGPYSRPRGVSREAFGRAQAKAVAHELETLGELLGRLEQLTAPPASTTAHRLPGQGTAARAVLESLWIDAVGKDHDAVRMLTGLTDPELAARITAGVNTVRPRRVDLVRSGLVEAVPDTKPTRWRLTGLADVMLEAERRG